MKKLVTTFVKYPFYANMVIAIIVVAGLLGFLGMKKSFFPERSSQDIIVNVSYPGASPKEMEEALTVRVEESIRGLVGIKEVNSTSMENFATVRITTTGEYELDQTLTEVKNAVDSISSLPVDAEKPIVFKQRSVTQALFMGLSGNTDLLTLKKYAQEIENDLLASGVISQVQILGLPALEISVEVTEENLLRYNLTFDEISRAISDNNRDISAGLIKSQEEEILIRSRARSADPNEIGAIVLRAKEDGSQLRIRDVATVKTKFADVSNRSYMNGTQAVYFRLSKLAEEDLDQISTFCRKYVEDFNAKEQGVKLDVTFDFLESLKARLKLLYSNGGIGLLLVVLSLGFFLNLRLSFWVAWGIPFSFLAMFLVASNAGITINMISLFGMILVIGILVDDGIVIAENIYTHFEKGKSPKRAAIDGTMEVLPAVTTSITTTIVAFTPLMFLEGRMEFLYEMAFVVIFSLVFSLVEAFLVLPAHVGTRHVLRSQKRATRGVRIRQTLDRWIAFLRYKLYGRLLKKLIQWRWVVVFVPLFVIMITVGLFSGGLIEATFFPSIPFNFIDVNVSFKPGSGEKKTMEHLRKFDDISWKVNEELIKEFPDQKNFINFTFTTIGSAYDGQENGSHAGRVRVMLRDLEGSPVSSFDISHRIKKAIGQVPGAEKFSVGGQNRFGSPISISLLGKDLDKLTGAKNMLVRGMEAIPAISNINDTNAVGKREVQLKLKPKAYFLGLNHADISRQVRQGFFGGQAQRLQEGKDELRVWVRYPKTNRINLGQLEAMKIKTAKGEFPLSELASYEIKRGPVNIKRFNSLREMRVDADLVNPYMPVPPILKEIGDTTLKEIERQFPGVKVVFQGQRRVSDESRQDMMKYFMIAFLVIVTILMLHFRSVLQALIILWMIPLSWIGAAWGHGVEGIPVSILSAWGMVALSGIIINDAVVFLAKYNQNLLEGMPVEKAVYDAGTGRFRAILLTSITTVAGLYPIVLEGSFQAQFLKPMAVALAYGVFIGTFFILLFFPALIMAANDLKVLFKWIWSSKKPLQEDVEPAIIHSKVALD
ncbi:MAG: efflux RND transporter permease subunit [bacterium]|nr:efflux RND transporter permease subunit [bacterium]